MSNGNFEELLTKSDKDAEVAKVSRDALEAHLQKQLKEKARIGAAILNKKHGESVYNIETAKKVVGPNYHWLVGRSFTIGKVTKYFVTFHANDAWGRSIGEFTVHHLELNLSTWDFAVRVREAITRVREAQKAELKRTKEQNMKKLRDAVKAAQRALDQAMAAEGLEVEKAKI
jgi:hypothetical protein